jgi:hypothetical protein
MGAILGPETRRWRQRWIFATTLALLTLLGLASGCTMTHTVSTNRLLAHQELIDPTGLKQTQANEALHVTSSPPDQWHSLALQKTALFTHQQWKSPTGATGSGVLYVHLPLPLSAKMVLWFAKFQYTRDATGDGKLLGQWTDELGRPWFEAEDAKYHVKGYAVVDGFSAWIVYFGYKKNHPANESELDLAAKYVQTVIPMTGERNPSKINLADAGKKPSVSKPQEPKSDGRKS